MSLTDTQLRNLKPTPAPKSVADERGLSILVQPNGAKWWRFRYRFDGKQKLLALGVYPDVSLKQAREKRDEARRLLAEGIDPGAHRKIIKTMDKSREADSFEAVAREWMSKQAPHWTDGYATKIKRRLEMDVFPWLGATRLSDVTAKDLLAVLRRIEERGALETAHMVQQICGRICRYGIATLRCERDLAADLRGALPPVKVTHMASITDPKEITRLLQAIDGYQGAFITRCALQLAPLLFVRPGELRSMEWSEIDFDKLEWRIPATKMKMREQHIVPLATQAVAILRELQPLTGSGKYAFPSIRSPLERMSENTVLAALRRLGYTKEEMTGHGFRSMASTLLNEQGWNRDAIERQLAHGERDKVRAAYNYAEHLPERRRMMQAWADYLDQLAGRNVVSLKSMAVSQ
ncbi:MAG: integrase arm-type DNA-binding domain-containing protein [Magnetococcales bacterium]|nr:integrase arm-type DNA-binding domain-containing protein [Magnetococcales bacterium]